MLTRNASIVSKPQPRKLVIHTEAGRLAAAAGLCSAGSFHQHRQLCRARATEMLAELKAAKVEAQRQYLARKAAESGAPPARS